MKNIEVLIENYDLSFSIIGFNHITWCYEIWTIDNAEDGVRLKHSLALTGFSSYESADDFLKRNRELQLKRRNR